MKKMGKEQIDSLKAEIEEFVNMRVCGGVNGWIDLWRRHSMNSGDYKADYIQMGMEGWNGYVYRKYTNIHYIWEKCKFNEYLTFVEFYMMFDSLWISVSVRMIRDLIGESSDELAY